MKAIKIASALLALCGLCTTAGAQSASDTIQYIVPGTTNIEVSWDAQATTVPVRANNDYTVTSSDSWLKFTRSQDGKRLYVTADTTFSNTPRTATLTLETADKGMVRTINVIQEEERSYETLIDVRHIPATMSASNYQSGENIERAFDGDLNTFWHTKHNSSISEKNPAVLTFGFPGTKEIDYMVYIPRQDAQNNGVWTTYRITVVDHGKTTTQTYTTKADKIPDTIRWENSIRPNQITIEVLGGYEGFASAAEIGFYSGRNDQSDLSIFADEVYSKLREGVTQADIDKLTNPFCKIIAQSLFDGTYNTEYRAASYPCRLSYFTLSNEWNAPGKYYSQIDNPTGINFRAGDEKAVIVSGIPQGMSAQICIAAWYVGKDGYEFDGGNPYLQFISIQNGINIIKWNYDWDGLAYIVYYAGSREQFDAGVPDIKVHIVNGHINGILTPDKTNEEMYELCKNAAENGNTCIDVYGNKAQHVWTSAGMRDYCKAIDGINLGYRQFINLVDSIVHWEHRLLGLEKYNRLPTNHTFAYTNYTFYMFQGGLGVSFHHGQEQRVLNCKNMILSDYDAIWGFSHEWGHQHQMHPYACWGSCSEVTNNIFSYYNVQKLGYTFGMDRNFVKWFWDNNFSGYQGTHSTLRGDAYKAATGNSNLFSYCKEMRDLCLAEVDNAFADYKENPARSYNIYEAGLGANLTAFNKLGNYATIYMDYADFYPDLFESLRQQNNLPAGSTVEKQGDFDKYELISAAQNGNKNQLYSILANKYPESCWVTENYLNKGNTSWIDNSIPALMCFIRKASRLYGYNLYKYFERGGFLTLGAFQHNDYGAKYSVMTEKMLNEFKADMKALEDDGTLKPLSDEMLYDIFHCRNFNESATDKLFPTPDIPN